MSTESFANVQISPADLTKIQDALTTLETVLMPHLHALTPDESRALPRVSEKNVSFVEKGLDYAQTHAQFAPSYLSIPDLQTDMTARAALTDIMQRLEPVRDALDDTIALCGSEAYVAVLSYYNAVKAAARAAVPGASAIADDLGQRFPGRSAKPAPPPVAKP